VRVIDPRHRPAQLPALRAGVGCTGLRHGREKSRASSGRTGVIATRRSAMAEPARPVFAAFGAISY